MTRHVSLNVQASVGLKDFQKTTDWEIPDNYDAPQVIAQTLRQMAEDVSEEIHAWEAREREAFDNDSATD